MVDALATESDAYLMHRICTVGVKALETVLDYLGEVSISCNIQQLSTCSGSMFSKIPCTTDSEIRGIS